MSALVQFLDIKENSSQNFDIWNSLSNDTQNQIYNLALQNLITNNEVMQGYAARIVANIFYTD